MNEESVNEPMTQPSDHLNEHLAAFGVPRRDPRGKKAYAERWHKSLGPRKQVTGPRGYSGTAPPIANLAPDDWRPRNVCSMSMDKALREMEFPSRLAGAEWVLE